MTKLAVMQPYVFPYIGYFQLIRAVDVFVFYDDVNYIKNGWINRNRILLNGSDHYLTIPCIKASPNRLINEIEVNRSHPQYNKLLKTIELAYKKAPYFDQVYPIIKEIFLADHKYIHLFAQHSIFRIAKYLGLETEFKASSQVFFETKGMDRADRLIAICHSEGADQYINAAGGTKLYDKRDFAKKNIDLSFIKSFPLEYKQFSNDFVPALSIIDVLMFNHVEELNNLLMQYELI